MVYSEDLVLSDWIEIYIVRCCRRILPAVADDDANATGDVMFPATIWRRGIYGVFCVGTTGECRVESATPFQADVRGENIWVV